MNSNAPAAWTLLASLAIAPVAHARVQMHERWFRPPSALSNPHGGNKTMKRGKCSGYTYPEYPTTPGACGLRVLPINVSGSSCKTARFTSFETRIDRFEPVKMNGNQVPHVYLGVKLLSGTDSARTVRCPSKPMYFELGVHGQGLTTPGGSRAGLYVRAAPNQSASSLLAAGRVKGHFGAYPSNGMASQGGGKMISSGAGYLTGDWNERSTFVTTSPMQLAAGIRAEKTASGRYKIFAYAKVQGTRTDGPAEDLVQVEVGEVSSKVAKSVSQAVDRFSTRCVRDQRLTFDGPLRSRHPAGKKVDPFRFNLQEAEFKDSSGRPISMNGVALHYPHTPARDGKACMSASLGITNLDSTVSYWMPRTAPNPSLGRRPAPRPGGGNGSSDDDESEDEGTQARPAASAR